MDPGLLVLCGALIAMPLWLAHTGGIENMWQELRKIFLAISHMCDILIHGKPKKPLVMPYMPFQLEQVEHDTLAPREVKYWNHSKRCRICYPPDIQMRDGRRPVPPKGSAGVSWANKPRKTKIIRERTLGGDVYEIEVPDDSDY